MKNKTLVAILKTNNINQIKNNIEILIKNNILDIIIINTLHKDEYQTLFNLIKEFKNNNQNLKIGHNFKNLKPIEVFDYLINNNIYVDYIWIETTYVGINKAKAKLLKSKWEIYKKLYENSLYIGGVLYDNQIQPLNPNYTITLANNYMDIVSTTYLRNDKTLSFLKIQSFRNILKEKDLCIVNGINANNIQDLFPFIDYFFISSFYDDNFYINEKELNLVVTKFNELLQEFQEKLEKKQVEEKKQT